MVDGGKGEQMRVFWLQLVGERRRERVLVRVRRENEWMNSSSLIFLLCVFLIVKKSWFEKQVVQNFIGFYTRTIVSY